MKICVDSSVFQTNSQGELTLVPGRQGIRDRVIFREPGVHTFNVADYPGLQRVIIQAVGGGGGSAGANAAVNQCIARPGGAGAVYAESIHNVSTIGASVAVTVGAGGAAGGPGTSGGAGGTSSFGGFVVAPGGDGGTAFMTSGTGPDTTSGVSGASTAGAAGGIFSGGGSSGGAFRLSGTVGMSGAGGDSRMGEGGFQRASEGDGGVPRGRGSGAGGALSYGEPVNGTAGADGLVMVWLIF